MKKIAFRGIRCVLLMKIQQCEIFTLARKPTLQFNKKEFGFDRFQNMNLVFEKL